MLELLHPDPEIIRVSNKAISKPIEHSSFLRRIDHSIREREPNNEEAELKEYRFRYSQNA